MKRRGSTKKAKPQAKTTPTATPRVEIAKRTKRVRKGPFVTSLVQRCLEFVASNPTAVFNRANQGQDGLHKVIRDVLTSWDSSRRNSVTRLPVLIENLFPFMTKLDLSYAQVNFGSLALCKQLASLNLKDTNIADKEFLAILSSNPGLQELDISSCRYITNPGLIKAMCGSRCDVRSLKLNNTELEGRSLRQIVSSYPNLAELGVSFCGKVTSVDIEHLSKYEPKELPSHSLRLQGLTSLNLSGFQHMTGVIGCICALPKLTSLNISHTDLNDRILSRIIQGCKGLTRLRLGFAGAISKKVLMDLPTTVPNLVDLSLAGQLYVDDFVVDQVTSYCIGLQSLDVSYTLFSGHFFITKTHEHLTSLNINSCTNIPTNEQFIQKIKAACPKLVRFQALSIDPLRQESAQEEQDEGEEEEDNDEVMDEFDTS